jgi:glyoxylase-like metal-dependent hydrolase (beta-lactamase superfamily II)
MGIVREMSERLWSGETSTEDRHPFTPLLVTEPLAEGAVFVSSFANVAAVSTGDGLVVVDVGGPHAGPMVLGALRTFSDDPLHAAIYTHGHLDHVAGMDTFDDEAAKRGRPRPRVIAHAAVPARFERYQLTRGWNACINTRQFGLPVKWPETW